MAEPIEMPFEIWTRVGPWKYVLGRGTYCRNLANIIEPSICGGDVACYQINFTIYLLLLGRIAQYYVRRCGLLLHIKQSEYT